MAKAIINKHIDTENELNNSLFISDNEHSKGEIVICNDKNNPSIYIKDTEGNITKIAGGSNDNEPYDDSELRAQINENTNDIKELKEKGGSVNIAESEEDKTESKDEINKNFLEYEEEENGLKSLAVRSIDTDATILQKDITVAGLTVNAGSYSNGDTISKGTNMYEILKKILCQELYPENVISKSATASASMNELTLTLNETNTVEVGTLITLTEGKTNGTEVNTTPSKIEGMTWGYSLENNSTEYIEDTEIEKECTYSPLEDKTYTISATINSGFDADTTTNKKTTPETQTGDGSASLNETNLGCAVEGENKITISATGASYSYHADAIDKVYYRSNLGNVDENKYNEGVPEVSDITDTPTNTTSKTVTGKYKYFFGYSEKTRYEDFTSDDIRGLKIKSDWIVKDGTTVITGEEKTNSNGKSIVVACPSKYKLSTFDSGVGASIIPNFTSVGNVSVKTGAITSDYRVYVYPITNNAVIEYKNITLTKV